MVVEAVAVVRLVEVHVHATIVPESTPTIIRRTVQVTIVIVVVVGGKFHVVMNTGRRSGIESVTRIARVPGNVDGIKIRAGIQYKRSVFG